MKAYRRNRGTAPLILNLVIRWKCMVIITPLPLYHRLRVCGWMSPIARLEDLEKRKVSFPWRDSNPGSSSPLPIASSCAGYSKSTVKAVEQKDIKTNKQKMVHNCEYTVSARSIDDGTWSLNAYGSVQDNRQRASWPRCPQLFSDCNEKWIFWTDFRKIFQCHVTHWQTYNRQPQQIIQVAYKLSEDFVKP
jgi:hypothetical protein